MMRLRGYGNAIVPSLAAEFVKAWLEVKEEVADADDNAAALAWGRRGGAAGAGSPARRAAAIGAAHARWHGDQKKR